MLMDRERIVIVGYRPHKGKEEQLIELIKTHVSTLREEGLASERPSILMRAKDGTIIEVFSWKSKEAIEKAHSNPIVQKMWQQYSEVCDYIPVGELDEMTSMFSEFDPI